MAEKQEKNKIKKESFPKKVLKYLSETAVNLLDLSFELIFDSHEFTKKYGCAFSYAPRAVYSLKKSPYFRCEKNKIYVTRAGRMRIIKNIIQNKKLKKVNNFWLGIIFDIPEINRRERAFLRKELRAAGCKELQKSVWITPFNIEQELKTLLALWKKDFGGDIRFLKIEKISGEEEVKRQFKIKQ